MSSVLISYEDPHGLFQLVARLLLKLLASLASLSDVPRVGDPPLPLRCRLGLREGRGEEALLRLYLARAPDEEGLAAFLQRPDDWRAGAAVLLLQGEAVPGPAPDPGRWTHLWRRVPR